jgi:hypothetical protein
VPASKTKEKAESAFRGNAAKCELSEKARKRESEKARKRENEKTRKRENEKTRKRESKSEIPDPPDEKARISKGKDLRRSRG